MRTNGESCTAHGECQSGFCVDGVCCNSSCGSGSTTDCMACSTGYGGTSNGTCTALSATFAPTVMCRAASGEACDVADYCVAGSMVCTNSYRPSSYSLPIRAGCLRPSRVLHRDISHVPNERCLARRHRLPLHTGPATFPRSAMARASIALPDALAPAGTICRASAGACDLAEQCSGTSAACPADGFVSGGTLCRAAVDACDAPELCPGSSPDCPSDSLLPSEPRVPSERGAL
ncbi:MAG: hypothetical protein M5U28_15425 [Sandaracinaceae bacterium]|nr:hypothetical protein [Sandaracinaceae bacterium]